MHIAMVVKPQNTLCAIELRHDSLSVWMCVEIAHRYLFPLTGYASGSLLQNTSLYSTPVMRFFSICAILVSVPDIPVTCVGYSPDAGVASIVIDRYTLTQ